MKTGNFSFFVNGHTAKSYLNKNVSTSCKRHKIAVF